MALRDSFGIVGEWADKLGEFVEKAATLDLGVVQFGALGQWQFFLSLALYMAVCIFALLVFYKFFIEYKIKVQLKYRIGSNVVDVKNDIAKVVTDTQGKRKLKLFYKKELSAPVPALQYKYKKGKKDYYEFIVDDNNNMHPCEIAAETSAYDGTGAVTDVFKTKIIPQERIAWGMMERKLIEERMRRKGWFDKHKEFILHTMMYATAVMVTYFMFDYLKKGSFAIAQQLGQIATNCMRMGG